MNPRDEDEVWRDIVDNYGDVPTVENVDPPAEPEAEEPEPTEEPETWNPAPWEDEGRYVPPPPPPVPMAEPPRLIAWIGLFGAPTILLIGLILGWSFPGWLSTLLVVSFVGGFGFLIATMNTKPQDPWDDGARI